MRRALALSTLLLLAGNALAADVDPKTQLVRELVDVLCDRSGSQLLWSRMEAAKTLAKLGPEARSAVPALAEFLDNPRRKDPPMIDEAVVHALGHIGRPARAAIPAMVRVSGRDFDLERAVHTAIDSILAAGGDAADIQALIKALLDKDVGTRLRSAKALGSLGPAAKAAIPALTEALHDADADVRHQALQSLRRVNTALKPSEAEVAVYIQDLHDPDAAVRLGAVKSLSRMGPALAPALQALDEAARDPDPDVRRLATDLLRQAQPR
jgi:HEAT repeat protein